MESSSTFLSKRDLRSLGELPQIMGGPTVCVVICLPRFVCLILSEMGPSGDVIGYHCGEIDTRECDASMKTSTACRGTPANNMESSGC
eukprot:m.141901 g.141901  ORF g.141901 m.141901 type:complete len:88 (+) comp22890_c0_seq1:214-477(+)